ncbi:TPA: HAD family hydrolase [Campylobacter coli]|uniref:HAD family hydrolase n=1 Tax=Campylobacter coli TaxID=195 RepID=UPI00294EF860|nr:HAD family hydrolase [Campylobacter coli]HEF9733726.1 HAD family hydrolase [Campylobacter coli]HEF9777279.1 HAD family hydrolase [Campylobacter coli]HEF9786493.1 HAD family hydrolase [Campylobacter coli]HEG0294781.1 HAD family hydrolase [Campylobacter coli]
MINIENIKNIIFDFDGVILDSVELKTQAFAELFQEFPKNKVQELLEFHVQNGGISRYCKIQYFFENILCEEISDKEISNYAKSYSQLTKERLCNPKYIIKETFEFIKKNQAHYNMHIASGADEQDLLKICDKLKLTQYFLSIHGSPIDKDILVKNILINNNYQNKETILIGDSINDFEVALKNNIYFYGV